MRLIRCFAMFLILMIPIHEAQAGALAYSGRMNKAIGGAIVKAAQRSGVAANDPRFAKTVYAAANEASFVVGAGTTAMTVAAIAGAPVWATVAVGVGVAAAFGYIAYKAYQLAADDDGKVYIQPDPNKPLPTKPKVHATLSAAVTHQSLFNGTFDATYGANAVNPYGTYDPNSIIYRNQTPSNIPPSVWKYRVSVPQSLLNGNNSYAYAMTPSELADKARVLAELQLYQYMDSGFVVSSTFHYTTQAGSNSPIPSANAKVVIVYTYTEDGFTDSYDFPVDFNPNYVPAVRESMSTDEAHPLIQQNANDPIDPAVVAKLANELWKRAASKPGYDGVPYDNANPLTPADVTNWKAENPADYPTQGDLLNPTNKPGEQITLNPDGSPNTVPPPNPDPNPNPDPIPNPGGDITIIVNPTPVTVNVNPEVDFGSYPNNAEPSLENISPSDIFDQIKSVVLPKTNLEEIGKSGECPKPTISLWTKDYVIDAHCDLFQSIAPVIQSIMLAVYAFLAFLIIMSA